MKKVLALIIAVLMLSSLVVVSTAAEDTVDWEAVTAGLGLNHYIGAETTAAPTVDGVVNAGEYPFSFRNGTKTIYNYTGGEIQSAVTEYIAHDADYVYYAVEFVQANDNRAFQWQFKPFNDFDIFRDSSDYTKYYYTRVSWQARYKVDEEGFWTDYAGSYQPSINDNCVRVPTATEVTDELYCVSGKTAENVKTYEVRLSKDYLAEVNDCEKSELRGFAYFTYFHSSAALGHIFTEDDLLAISDVDYTVFLPSANELGYRFIVLADVSTAPEGYVAPVAGEDFPVTDGGDTGDDNDDDDQQTTTTTTTTTTTADTDTTTTTTTTTKKADAATTTTAAATEEPAGCKGSIAISALVIAPVLAGGAVLLKKKED